MTNTPKMKQLSLWFALLSLFVLPSIIIAKTNNNNNLFSLKKTNQIFFGIGSPLEVRGGGGRGGKGRVTKSTPPPPPPPPAPTTKSGSSSSGVVGTGTASISSEVFNLIKAIVGVGVLSLPSGIAAFTDKKVGIIPGTLLITIIGILSGYGFYIIGKVCALTESTSFREAWEKSVDKTSSWIPVLSVTIKTFLACLAFSMVLADSVSSLLSNTSFKPSRRITLLVITYGVLLPLCLLKNLKSLAPFSLLGVLGMIYTAIAMTIRYLDGNYILPTVVPAASSSLEEAAADAAAGVAAEAATATKELLVDQVAKNLQPFFASSDGGMFATICKDLLQPSSLILVCMLSTAYMAHFNAPKFYVELYDNTLPRFGTVVSLSFGVSILLMGFITGVGFLTFGKNASGMILNNYSTNDKFINFSKIAVTISLVFSYPLAFVGFRDGILDFLLPKTKDDDSSSSSLQSKPWFLNVATLVFLSIITLLADTLQNVSFVLALGGATLGNALTYVYPAIMYKSIVKKQNLKGEGFGVSLSVTSAVLGIIMGAIGVHMTLTR